MNGTEYSRAKTIKEMLLERGSVADDDTDHVDHLGAAILSIIQQVKDGSMDPEEGKRKVLAAYKLAMDEPDEEEEAGEPKKKNAPTQESRVFRPSRVSLQESSETPEQSHAREVKQFAKTIKGTGDPKAFAAAVRGGSLR